MESSLDDDLEADSLDVIEIITALEDEFNITFQQEKSAGDGEGFRPGILY